MTVPTLSYDHVGDGEPLLLLHGFGSTREDFAALTPDLAQDFSVLSIHSAAGSRSSWPASAGLSQWYRSHLPDLGCPWNAPTTAR
jgi:predicted esterase